MGQNLAPEGTLYWRVYDPLASILAGKAAKIFSNRLVCLIKRNQAVESGIG